MRRYLRRPVVLVASVLAAALVAVVLAVVARGNTVVGPTWAGDINGCRANPMQHVHDPHRLTLLNRCSTVSGTVRSVRFVPAFDDVRITMVPDEKTRGSLAAANHGLLVADVIATDQARVRAPARGSQVTVWGAWVLDKATKTTMLLPAYRIAVTHRDETVIRGHSHELHGPSLGKQLKLHVTAPRRVPVGGQLDITVRAQWLYIGVLSPAPQVHLFTEMTAGDGTGVRWKAAMTDALGVVTMHLVAIQVPGTYAVTVYGAPAHQSVAAKVVVKVARR